MEASLPLKPIETAATRSQERSVVFLIGGAVVVWMLLLPLWLRLARSQAKDWVPGRRRTLRAFREALDRGQIELVYQPQIEPGSRRVDAVEALVRWRRNGQLITPDHFLPAVESSPLMPRLTDRVLDLALAQLANWCVRNPDHACRSISRPQTWRTSHSPGASPPNSTSTRKRRAPHHRGDRDGGL